MVIAKFTYIHSKALMQAYRLIVCQNCGTDNGTVCGAHSNQEKHGKAMGKKASDQFCASLCTECHYEIDNGVRLTRSERFALWDKAHKKTVKRLTQLGLYQW
jgi:hypothetical protein|tara:strand:- start:11940 stop:12245 length:306 start_codon:yes stop_codon:yes gene_type:complete